MATARSVCPLDCPDRCSLDVQVDGGRVVSLEGNRLNPITAGFICSKVRRYPERLYGADRLLRPVRRTGRKGQGQFDPVSWDAALDEIAERLRSVRETQGGEAILPFAYGGSNGLVTQGTVDEDLFRSLGASRLLRTVCAAQTGAASEALYGGMASIDLADVEHARFILIWGANPKHSNVHLLPFLKRAREAGARVALVDPRRTLGGGYVDRHLAVFPGSDLVVALSMIDHLARTGGIDRNFLAAHATGSDALLARAREWPLERAATVARIGAREIASLAEEYAEAQPALVRCGWGVERNRNGEAAVAAILALPAVAGKFGRRGGGYALSTSEAYRVRSASLSRVPETNTRAINMSQLGRALLDEAPPRISLLFVYDANPAVTLPDQKRVLEGLGREDLFTVVFDQVLTDTALYADIVLPATTFLEQSEVAISYGTYAVQLSEPVIPAVGEARSNTAVFSELARRLGVGLAPEGDDARVRRALGAIEGPVDLPAREDRLEAIRRDGVLRLGFEGRGPVQFETAFPGTPDGKVRLWPEEWGTDPYRFLDEPADAAHPLALISPSSDRSICSTLGEFGFDQVFVEMHPGDAEARGLASGAEVRIHNVLGEVRVPLRLNSDVRPGVAHLPKGIWNRHTRNGLVGAALVPDALSAVSKGACFNDARVEVSAVPQSEV
jgi:anaerobic selenocysteine-containing dehydrogenase